MPLPSSRATRLPLAPATWLRASWPAWTLQPSSIGFMALLSLLAALPAVSIDVSQPTLLATARQFSVAPGKLGLTITLFMVGFAIGQLVGGPLSDLRGRRPVLLWSLAGYSLAAFLCALAGSAEALIGWRLFQGAAAGACANLAFVMIRDLFDNEVARAKRSYVTAAFALAPILAPTAGAWVLATAGWRPIYLLLACNGVVLLAVAAFGLAESRPPGPADAAGRGLLAAYGPVLKQPRFLRLIAVNACSYGAVFAYIAGSPQVLMTTYGLSPYRYGLVFASTAAALTGGAVVSGRAAKAGVTSDRLLTAGLLLGAGSAAAMAIGQAIRTLPLPPLLALLIVHLFCRGLAGPNAQHLALERLGGDAGTASAAIGVTQILFGALCSAAVWLLPTWWGSSAMTSVMAASAIAALLLRLLSPAPQT